MGLFGKKGDSKKVKYTHYTGYTMQPIGQIPNGASVVLTLIPDNQSLMITYNKTTNIILPFDRIESFTCKIIYEDKTNDVVKSAKNFLQNVEIEPTGFDPFGAKKIVAGLAGNVAGNLIPSNLKVYTICTLFYIDKSGNKQYLQFYTARETGNILKTEENIRLYTDQSAFSFSTKVAMLKSQQAERITEL